VNTPNPKSPNQIGRLPSDNLKQHSDYTGFAESLMWFRRGKCRRYDFSMSKILIVAGVKIDSRNMQYSPKKREG